MIGERQGTSASKRTRDRVNVNIAFCLSLFQRYECSSTRGPRYVHVIDTIDRLKML